MKLRILPDERFSCHSCSNCCRDWHVELLDGEAERISTLNWPPGDPLQGAMVLLKHSGRMYLAHRDDGACVFLNPVNNLCRIHERFGGDVKPVGCQLYPFQIMPTPGGDATVTARFDCPTVRRNEGEPHTAELPQLRRLAAKLNLPTGVDDATCCYLDADQIEAICEFAGTLINGFSNNVERTLFLGSLCDWLQGQSTDNVDRPALAQAFGGIKAQVNATAGPGAAPVDRPGLVHRLAFRTLLALYLRRDEDVLNGRAGRFGRMVSMIAVVLGFGGFHGLGVSHPKGKLSGAHLFRPTITRPDLQTTSLFWRMIQGKLASRQFFGPSNRGRDFLTGLRSLAMLYPLVLAVAKYRAATRNATQVDPTDIDYAVAAIEHSFGRAAVLAQPFAKSLERLLNDRDAFTRLVQTL